MHRFGGSGAAGGVQYGLGIAGGAGSGNRDQMMTETTGQMAFLLCGAGVGVGGILFLIGLGWLVQYLHRRSVESLKTYEFIFLGQTLHSALCSLH